MSEETKSLGDLLPSVYKDAAQPAVQSAGKALGSVADLVFHPVGRCAEIVKKNIDKFLNKFDGEEKDNITPPEPSVAVPILQKLFYTEEDELIELYTELLKNGCLKNAKDRVLPAYVNMISSLTPDEVRIIDFLFKRKYVVKLQSDTLAKTDLAVFKSHRYEANNQGIFVVWYDRLPFLEIRDQENPEAGGAWQVSMRYFTDITDRIILQKPNNIELYFDNMKAVGIFDIDAETYMVPKNVYDLLENSARILDIKAGIEKKGNKMVLQKGQMKFTQLGSSFVQSCTLKPSK